MVITVLQLAMIIKKNFQDPSFVPIDTSNLQNRGISDPVQFSPTSAGIKMGGPNAPYGPITTLPWISPKWNGKKNPNQGWAIRAAQSSAEEIAGMIGGDVE